MTVAQWAEKYRYISAENSALPGKYSLAITPYLRGILECINDRSVRKVVCQKSAQVGWTDGVINNLIGYTIHIAPAPVIVMFPRDQNAKDYNVEKFNPMVEATPVLTALVQTKTRTADNTQNRKKFPGGFLKFIGSNSTGGVKSTPAKIMIVEEPDDCNLNIKGQGDSIKLLEERGKTYHDRKVIAGGTPSIKGVSSIVAEMLESDQRKNFVPCHECGESHVLAWENVHWHSDETRSHSVYGHALPETAYYACPNCGALWNDAQKNRGVRNGEWRATAEFRGVAGFYLNELYSPFAESKLTRLVEKYLAAKAEEAQGDIGALIAFWNSSLGLSWEYQSDLPTEDVLKDRAEEYEEFIVPWGGLVLTAGVDVQHDRLAVVIRAWGRGEESWLLYWGEIHGDTRLAEQGAWIDLDALLTREFVHAGGTRLMIRAVSIDSSDGTTSDPVYSYVRRRLNKNYMAVKGASTDDGREIFAPPKSSVDTNRQHKHTKHGLKPFMVGTSRAKDLLLEGRLQLTGSGPGRMHWYDTIRPDYWEQITSEIKVPHRTIRNKKVWQKKSGVRNEALDCEVYALHASRSLKLNLYKESHWLNLEQKVRQADIFAEPATATPAAAVVPDAPPAAEKPVIKPKPAPFNPGRKGYSASRW